MKKQKLDLHINSQPPGPKNSNFEGVKIFLGYPILGFLTLKTTKKIIFFFKIKNLTSIPIHRLLAQKIQLWGCQNILGPKNMFEVPHIRIFDPWKYQKMIFFTKNITKFACWNIANFVTLLMKKIIFLVLLGVKNSKMGYSKNIFGPKLSLCTSVHKNDSTRGLPYIQFIKLYKSCKFIQTG